MGKAWKAITACLPSLHHMWRFSRKEVIKIKKSISTHLYASVTINLPAIAAHLTYQLCLSAITHCTLLEIKFFELRWLISTVATQTHCWINQSINEFINTQTEHITTEGEKKSIAKHVKGTPKQTKLYGRNNEQKSCQFCLTGYQRFAIESFKLIKPTAIDNPCNHLL